ncbi:MAG: 16S rRNA (cytosine(1402)-N(4))-methyltransferase RsmH [Pleurocapsa minor GSE-CHR-MK-17-07R]|jgi:16S rRNA (cytosine1402-N4)-methyltransferase|nr:16S rRNA (cytosine(1402)-N(4))-methyltransferase RsmH [Pleurocapsa minor GSE-CHR-MK 17-07R]
MTMSTPSPQADETPHVSVMLGPVLAALLPEGRTIERVIDGTAGAGGHSAALLDHGAQQLMAFDLDPTALGLARAGLARFGDRARVIHDSYANMRTHAQAAGWGDGVDAILLDLGVSSMQFDQAERGFAFRYDAPLDMRFDPTSGRETAADILNTWPESDLADIFYRYGEEYESRRVARAVVKARPLHTTRELADVLEAALPRHPRDHKHIHPATKVFQALRIAVNDELETVESALPIAMSMLRQGGRLAVISFHSLEDRLAKDAFRLAATDCICPPKAPVCVCGHRASVKLITRKPLVADDEEVARNPRSRSAKLRVVEKL